jgi:hypothetical protein
MHTANSWSQYANSARLTSCGKSVNDDDDDDDDDDDRGPTVEPERGEAPAPAPPPRRVEPLDTRRCRGM